MITRLMWIAGLALALNAAAIDEYSNQVDPMLDSAPVTQAEQPAKVTAVYGVGSEDYLPLKEEARQQLRPNLRKSNAHPSFDLPDAFYFIGGPIFLLILLRVLTLFLNEFEEKRKQEQRLVASEHAPGERVAGE